MECNSLLCYQSMLQEENCQKKCDKEGKNNISFHECEVFTSGGQQSLHVVKADKKSYIISLQLVTSERYKNKFYRDERSAVLLPLIHTVALQWWLVPPHYTEPFALKMPSQLFSKPCNLH